MTLTADSIAATASRRAARPTFLVWPVFAFFVFLLIFPAAFIFYQKTRVPRAYAKCAKFTLPDKTVAVEIPPSTTRTPAAFPPQELAEFLTVVDTPDSATILHSLTSIIPLPTTAPGGISHPQTVFLHEILNNSRDPYLIFTYALFSHSRHDIELRFVHHVMKYPTDTFLTPPDAQPRQDFLRFKRTDTIRVFAGQTVNGKPNAFAVPVEVNGTTHTLTFYLTGRDVRLFSTEPPLP